jgi:hypothetical protein
MAGNSLKLGNLANRVEAIGANTMENQARSLALGNTFSGIADTLAGKDYQAGMSGFEQALIAGARGAATGFQGKAAIEKAKGQDELNAWVQELQAAETQNAASEARLAREKAAEQKYASIIASAVIGAQGDPERLKQTLPMYYKMMAQESGYEVVSITPQGDNPYVYSVTLKDPEDGTTETQDVNPTALGQYVFEQDADLGKQFVAALGGFDPAKLQKAKEPTGKLAELQQYREALASATTPEERMQVESIFGKGSKSAEWTEGDKQAAKNLQAEAERLNKIDYSAMGTLASTAADRIIETGLDVNWLSKSDIAQGVASLGALGGNAKREAEIWSIVESALQELTLPKVKALGAGTGISNADREFASKIVNKQSDTSETILQKMALQKAIAEVQDEFKQLRLDANALSGEFEGMTPSEAQAALRNYEKAIAARSEDDPRGVRAKAAAYEQQYLQAFRTKKNPQAAAQVQAQQSQGPDLSGISEEELRAIAGE